ncbi:MAG: hypothetical protein JWM77_547 [Rhodospirillales bacterium]|nr:hypothetical protein [Rhodospirillales bacterium]
MTQAGAAEPSWRDFPGVSNTSYVEPSGDRAIQLSITVKATPQAVFDAFATETGFESWAVPMAKIDLRVGGMIEASYNADAKLGDPDNIKNRIAAYVPGRLLVIHNVQAPRDLPGRDEFAKTVTIIELAPDGAGATRVTLTNAGYGHNPGADAAYAKFEWGDAYTLHGLQQRFENGPVNWAEVVARRKAAAADKQVTGK